MVVQTSAYQQKIALLNICIKMQILILPPFIKIGKCRRERINNGLVCVPFDLKVLIEGLSFCLGKIIADSGPRGW